MPQDSLDFVLGELTAAWRTGDGKRLAAVFAEDATMVDVRGRILNGRVAVEREHQALFDTIFRGAKFDIELIDSRHVGDGLALAHTSSVVIVPEGPGAGRHRGIQTLLLAGGEVLAFHNTSQAD